MEPRLNYRQVQAFKAVFECSSMTLAAERLSISQPAVSKLIGQLERRVGFALFDRASGRLLATTEGRLLYEDVERALTGIESLGEKARDIRERRYGRLVIGAMPALSLGLMQSLVADMIASHPSITVDLQTRTSPQLLTLIAARQLDVAAIAHLGRNPLVHIEALHRIAMVCALPPGHRLASRDVIRARDLEGEPFISLSMLDQLGPRIRQSLISAGVHPVGQVSTALAASACAFVAKGLGVAIVDPFSTTLFSRDHIVVRPFDPLIEIEIAVVRSQDLRPSPVGLATELIGRLNDALARHATTT